MEPEPLKAWEEEHSKGSPDSTSVNGMSTGVFRPGLQDGYELSPLYKILEEFRTERETEQSLEARVLDLAGSAVLSRDDVEDRGPNHPDMFTRYSLNRPQRDAVGRTMAELQVYIQRIVGLIPERKQYFLVDPKDVIRRNLNGSQSLGQLQAAWTSLSKRANTAMGYISSYENEYLTGNKVLLSPATTTASALEAMPAEADDGLRYLLSSYPRHASDFSREQRKNLRKKEPWEKIVPLPPWMAQERPGMRMGKARSDEGEEEAVANELTVAFDSRSARDEPIMAEEQHHSLDLSSASRAFERPNPHKGVAPRGDFELPVTAFGAAAPAPLLGAGTPFLTGAGFLTNMAKGQAQDALARKVAVPATPNVLHKLGTAQFSGIVDEATGGPVSQPARRAKSSKKAADTSDNWRDRSAQATASSSLARHIPPHLSRIPEEGIGAQPHQAGLSASAPVQRNRAPRQQREVVPATAPPGRLPLTPPPQPRGRSRAPSPPAPPSPSASRRSRSSTASPRRRRGGRGRPPGRGGGGGGGSSDGGGGGGRRSSSSESSASSRHRRRRRRDHRRKKRSRSRSKVSDGSTSEDEPPAPYGKFVPTIKPELKPDQVPVWDGNPETALTYFWEIQQLASLGGYLPQAIGYFMWMGLPKGSAVRGWFMVLSSQEQEHMRKHYLNFIKGIKDGFLGKNWQIMMNTVYERQSFREKGHENETPIKFITRRVMYTRLLVNADDGGPLEVFLVLQKAPVSWSSVVNFDSVRNVSELFSKVSQHEKALIFRAQEEKSQAVTAESLPYLLRKLGVSSRQHVDRNAHLVLGGGDNTQESDPAQSLEGEETLNEAFQVVKKGFQPPTNGYPFKRNDHVKTKLKKLPPSPCRACGSPNHWNKECPDWEVYQESRKRTANAAMSVEDDELETAYSSVYSVLIDEQVSEQLDKLSSNPTHPGFDQAAREVLIAASNPLSNERKSKSRSRRVSWEEVEDEEKLAAAQKPKSPAGVLLEEVAENGTEGTRYGKTSCLTKEVENACEDSEQSSDSPYFSEAYIASLPTPTEDLTIRVPKSRLTAPGRSAVGISVCAVKGHVGTTENPLVDLRLDSCTDVTLISEEYYNSLVLKPRLRQGLKMSLWQLTDSDCQIKGYIRTPILIPLEEGVMLELEAEAYVVPRMTVPILLGEDFHLTYELGIQRSVTEGTTVSFAHSPHRVTAQPVGRTADFSRLRSSAHQVVHFVKRKTHRRTKARRARIKRLSAVEKRTVRAAQSVRLKPQQCVRVKVEGHFDCDHEWYFERTLLPSASDSAVVIPNTLLKAREPYLTVSNTSTRHKTIRKGEALGYIYDPGDTFDVPLDAQAVEELVAKSAVYSVLIQSQNTNTPTANTQPEADEEESYGPKTAALPDPEIYPSQDLRKLLDVGDLPDHLKERAWAMLEANQKAFGFDGRLGQHPSKVKIRTRPNQTPISLPMYGSSPAKRKVIDEQIDKWFEQEVIEPSQSPWGAPVVIAYRNGKARFCVDYRKLNAVTTPDEFPIPRQSEILASLSGAHVLSSLDALSGFTQLEMDDQHKEKTAFRTHRGLFQFKRMPFGLRNGPSIFQRVMQGILAPFLWIFCLVYIDDIVIYSKSYEEHIDHLNQVLGQIAKSGITLSPTKCHMFYGSILLLGHKVSRLGLSTHREKVKAVLELERPTKVSELQSFIGMAVYFSSFIPFFSDTCVPLFALLKKDTPWEWLAEHEEAWTKVKAALQQAPVLGHPIEGRPYRLYTDASDYALGCALQQVQSMKLKDLKGTKTYETCLNAFNRGEPPPKLVVGLTSKVLDDLRAEDWEADFDETKVYVERVIAYWSRTFKPAETRYSATEREALGAKEGLVRFQPFIEGETIILVTDHAALQWARTYENSNRRLAAWGAIFSAYAPGLEIVHRPGRKHSNVDPLLRLARVAPLQVSPKEDDSPALSLDLPELSEERSGPARRVSFVAHTWHDVLETTEDELSCTAFQARRARRKKARQSDATASPNEAKASSSSSPEPKDAEEEEEEYRTVAHLHLGDKALREWVQGYQNSASFKAIWEDPRASADSWSPGYRYFKDENGMLFFRDANMHPRLCVPESHRKLVIKWAHESPSETAHRGVEKLWFRLSSKYYWRRMKVDVEKFCATCDVCQKTKPSNFSKWGFLMSHPVPDTPYASISMDFIVNLPMSGGFNAIYVVVDRLTKHANFIPTTTGLSARDFGSLFVKHVVCKWGLPENTICDRDPRWTSDFWRAVAKELKSEMLFSSSHHPQTDGQTEIVNKALEVMLRVYVNSDKTNWSEWLHLLEFAYNSTIHSSTNSPPFKLLLGYSPRSALDFLPALSSLSGSTSLRRDSQQFLSNIAMHRESARLAIAKAQHHQALAYNNRRRSPPALHPSDLVLINPHSLEWLESKGLGAKLGPRWIGPFEITEKISDVVYRLRLPDSYPGSPVFNIAHLKKYEKDPEDGNRTILPDSAQRKEASEEGEVEAILGHRVLKGANRTRQYLVRWVGYGPQHDEWLTAAALRNATAVLREYQLKAGLRSS